MVLAYMVLTVARSHLEEVRHSSPAARAVLLHSTQSHYLHPVVEASSRDACVALARPVQQDYTRQERTSAV